MVELNASRFISLLSDITFKTIWQGKGREFLNRVIYNITKINIEDFILYMNELPIENYEDISNKVDILLVNIKKRIIINVELNKDYYKAAKIKNNIYLHKLKGNYHLYFKELNRYIENIKILQVNINNYLCKKDKKSLINKRVITEKSDKILNEEIIAYDVYLPALKEICYDEYTEEQRDLLMFEVENYEEMKKIIKGNKEREIVMEELEKLGSEKEYVDLYDHDEFYKALRKEKEQRAVQRGIDIGRKESEEKIKLIIQNLKLKGMNTKEINSIVNFK